MDDLEPLMVLSLPPSCSNHRFVTQDLFTKKFLYIIEPKHFDMIRIFSETFYAIGWGKDLASLLKFYYQHRVHSAVKIVFIEKPENRVPLELGGHTIMS